MSSQHHSCTGVAVVTGAGGIGVACALRFGQERSILLAEASPERLERALVRLREDNIQVTGVVCDISQRESVEALARAVSAQGGAAILLHTAGLSPAMADAQRILSVNYLGTAYLLDAFQAQLRSGCVTVCIASMAGHRLGVIEADRSVDHRKPAAAFDALLAASRGQSRVAYSLSKRGVIRLVEQCATAWAERGARIVSVSPGLIDTEMGRLETGTGEAGDAASVLNIAPLKRFGRAEEIAGAAYLLCQPEASFVTGSDLLVDGGAVARLRQHVSDEARQQWDYPWR